MITRVLVYLRSWRVFFQHLRACRMKKHGAGRQPWSVCIRLAATARYGIYFQHYAPDKWPVLAPKMER